MITTPPNLNNWLGREKEISQLQTWLCDTAVNLIGIQGLGGVGKSALAAYLYKHIEFSDKFWADISQKPDFVVFAEKVITAFGGQVTKQGDIDGLINDLLTCLSQRRCLLVVDNLETLLTQSRQWQDSTYEQFFSRWLQQGSNSTLLLTTQEKPILFQSQPCWHLLRGMNISDGGLLLQRLGIQETVTQLEEFSKAVDGHPLTLQLVAGYLREYCHSQLSSAWELGLKQFELVAEAQGVHRDKQDARLSWILQQHFQRLTPVQQNFLVNLSVYRQAFNHQAAGWMLASETEVVKPVVVQKELRELFNRSLLLETEDRKYRFQPLVQQYAQQQTTDINTAHQKAIAYYNSNTKQQPWQTLEDVRAYLEIFYHYCQLEQYAQAFDTIGICDEFLDLRGYNTIRVEVYGQLVQEWKLNQDNQWKLSASLTFLGNAYYSLGQYQQAIEYHQKSLKIFRAIGNRSGIANSLNNLGIAYNFLRQYQQALDYLQQSLQIFQQIPNHSGIAKSLMNLGIAYNCLGKYQQALDYLQQSLQIFQQIVNRSGIAHSLMHLGIVYKSLGKYQQALDYLQQSLQIFQQIGNRSGISDSLNNLGIAYKSLGKYQQALDYYQQSLQIKKEIGNRFGIANSLMNLGNAYYALGKYQQALDYYQQSLQIKKEIGNRSGTANSLIGLGIAYNCLRQYQRALDYFQQSLPITQEIGDRHGEAKSCFNSGFALKELGKTSEAITAYRNARQLYQAMGLDAKVQNCDHVIETLNST
ncbi:MAG: tetratricopeptide repeat protein [Symploca sp. SIO2E9]|nr:tetratricopeptide repeat protein [Symploca sp. SIO2E9]